MKCEEFRNTVYEFAAGELSDEAAKAAAAHAESCPECRKEYETCLELVKSLAGLDEEPAPESLLPNVMRKISAEKNRRKFNIIRFGTAAAAAVVLVVGAVNVLPQLKKEVKPTEIEEVVDNEVTDDEAVIYDEEEATDEALGIMPRMIDEPAEDTDVPAVVTGSGNAEQKRTEQNDRKSAPKDDAGNADEGIMPMTLPHGDNGSSGASELVVPIITYGIYDEDDAVVEVEERSFISRSCEFTVAAEYAETALAVSTAGKSMAQVSAELNALGVDYEVYVVEDDYTKEYRSADPQRRAEIERLCAADRCTIKVV